MYKSEFVINNKEYQYYDLKMCAEDHNTSIESLPITLKIILENLLRNFDDNIVTRKDIESVFQYNTGTKNSIFYYPARVLMQDFTGVPAIVDFAAMRDYLKSIGKDPYLINPCIPSSLIVDHSVQVDSAGTMDSLSINQELEFERNGERYKFLNWGMSNLKNFTVVPSGVGICHQINIEYLSQVVSVNEDNVAMFDTVIGTDSHTTMVNALSVLGWGVGGIEAEVSMLKQPITMLVPQVIGVKLTGVLSKHINATDLVLHITHELRKKNVVGKFVEFFGDSLASIDVPTRATIGNMAPECGSTCNLFPVDESTLEYLYLTGKTREQIDLIRRYSMLQGTWGSNNVAKFHDTMEIDLSEVKAIVAGPSRPQDKILLSDLQLSMKENFPDNSFDVVDRITNGSVVIAAITSCTNTSNPSVIITAALIAKKAVELGLETKPWVKTSFAPGSKVVTEYLRKSGLQRYLDILGFNIIGYGCTTCIGNSGPLQDDIEHLINQDNLIVSAVLSGNRNFEGRIHPLVKANYLASPPLVVLFALVGTVSINLETDPIGYNKKGDPVYIQDLWPDNDAVDNISHEYIKRDMFRDVYSKIFNGGREWNQMQSVDNICYEWDEASTYIAKPPFFDGIENFKIQNVDGAYILCLFGDSITTDHISPAGNIPSNSPAGKYLQSRNVPEHLFNSYGSRRGNFNVMIRGTFANIRIKNLLADGKEGGYTKSFIDNNRLMTIYDAAMKYKDSGHDVVIFAGKEYGTGSSRDWAAKGTSLLGVKAVVANSFERIHKSNLIGMGVIPLVFSDGDNISSLGITGAERVYIDYIDNLSPNGRVQCIIKNIDDQSIYKEFTLIIDVNTDREIEYLRSGGIMNYALSRLC
ncbi:MAG: aconitate hydratase 1 [Candidatus Xenolissoclinum pacificiensis L6]|uniref:Aconitate hydratase n=1 Tax=Candidatus Xenolissoclinum pacificiensis L6 TaxID=1401685 RepID=W2V0P2_9RICK|nr:MAG: aconitate hydratase 1 [Candidatus Xenolissoclinum pacificiensis L6]